MIFIEDLEGYVASVIYKLHFLDELTFPDIKKCLSHGMTEPFSDDPMACIYFLTV